MTVYELMLALDPELNSEDSRSKETKVQLRQQFSSDRREISEVTYYENNDILEIEFK